MARTLIRASQFRSKDIQELQMASGSVSGSTANKNGVQGTLAQGTVSTPDVRPGAVTPSKVAAAPVMITSANGIITLNDDSGFFIVDGTENISRIAGWNFGRATIQWQEARTIVHTGGQLELSGGVNHPVSSGDISTFIFYSSGHVREIGFVPKTPTVDTAPDKVEIVAVQGQTVIPLNVAPVSKAYVTATVNGMTVFGIHYEIVGSTLVFSSPLDAGDEVCVVTITKAAAAAMSGGSVYDGGTV